MKDGKPPESRSGDLRDAILDASRRWGILPPKLREEALSSTGKEAPQEYMEILSRYYRKMSEAYEKAAGR